MSRRSRRKGMAMPKGPLAIAQATAGGIALSQGGNGQETQEVKPRSLIGPLKTRGYRPSMYASYPTWFSLGWGAFSLALVDIMRRDPQVALCLSYRQAPIWSAQFNITADTPQEQDYVDRTVKRFWSRSLGVAIESMAYGYSAAEVVYRYHDGGVWFHHLRSLHPKDCHPFTLRGHLAHIHIDGIDEDGDGSSTGHGTAGTDLLAAKENRPAEGFWLTHDPKYAPWYGRSILMPSWWFWRLKTMEDGIVESIFKWLYKHSISCTIVRHPNQVYDGPGGSITPAQDLGREMVDNVKAGGVMAMSSDKDEYGDYLWKIEEWAQPNGAATSLIEVADWVDKQIQRGMLIPDEVITHDGNTGGYSRSQVAASAFFMHAEQDLEHILEAFDDQILRPLVLLNFKKATYKVEPQPLLMPDQGQLQQMQQQQQQAQAGQPPAGPTPQGQQQGQQPLPWSQGVSLPGQGQQQGQPQGAPQQMSVVTLARNPLREWGRFLTDEAPHVRIVGGTASGKTTLARAIAANVPGQIVVLDPVATPGAWGDVKAITVAPDGSYGPIDDAIKSLLEEMKRRGAELQAGKTDFPRLTVIFDEVPDTVAELPNSAGLLIRRLAQRGRHENMHLIGLGQSSRVEAWGIAGYGDVAENFVTVYLGNKAIDVAPQLAGMDYPGVLEWEGVRYPVDLSQIVTLAKRPIGPEKQFPLDGATATSGAPVSLSRFNPQRDRFYQLAVERYGAQRAVVLVREYDVQMAVGPMRGTETTSEYAERRRRAQGLGGAQYETPERDRMSFDEQVEDDYARGRRPRPLHQLAKDSRLGIFKYENGSDKDKVSVSGETGRYLKDAIAKIFGPGATIDDVALVAGAVPGSHVKLRVTSGGSIEANVSGSHYRDCARTFSIDPQGVRHIHNDIFKVKADAPAGFGLDAFSREVYYASQFGFKEISTTAAGSKREASRNTAGGWNGYYTWPRFGYDGLLSTTSEGRDAMQAFPGVHTMRDLFATREGRDWWKENGGWISLTFNLDPKGKSMRALAHYQDQHVDRLRAIENGTAVSRTGRPIDTRGLPPPPRSRSTPPVVAEPINEHVGTVWAQDGSPRGVQVRDNATAEPGSRYQVEVGGDVLGVFSTPANARHWANMVADGKENNTEAFRSRGLHASVGEREENNYRQRYLPGLTSDEWQSRRHALKAILPHWDGLPVTNRMEVVGRHQNLPPELNKAELVWSHRTPGGHLVTVERDGTGKFMTYDGKPLMRMVNDNSANLLKRAVTRDNPIWLHMLDGTPSGQTTTTVNEPSENYGASVQSPTPRDGEGPDSLPTFHGYLADRDGNSVSVRTAYNQDHHAWEVRVGNNVMIDYGQRDNRDNGRNRQQAEQMASEVVNGAHDAIHYMRARGLVHGDQGQLADRPVGTASHVRDPDASMAPPISAPGTPGVNPEITDANGNRYRVGDLKNLTLNGHLLRQGGSSLPVRHGYNSATGMWNITVGNHHVGAASNREAAERQGDRIVAGKENDDPVIRTLNPKTSTGASQPLTEHISAEGLNDPADAQAPDYKLVGQVYNREGESRDVQVTRNADGTWPVQIAGQTVQLFRTHRQAVDRAQSIVSGDLVGGSTAHRFMEKNGYTHVAPPAARGVRADQHTKQAAEVEQKPVVEQVGNVWRQDTGEKVPVTIRQQPGGRAVIYTGDHLYSSRPSVSDARDLAGQLMHGETAGPFMRDHGLTHRRPAATPATSTAAQRPTKTVLGGRTFNGKGYPVSVMHEPVTGRYHVRVGDHWTHSIHDTPAMAHEVARQVLTSPEGGRMHRAVEDQLRLAKAGGGEHEPAEPARSADEMMTERLGHVLRGAEHVPVALHHPTGTLRVGAEVHTTAPRGPSGMVEGDDVERLRARGRNIINGSEEHDWLAQRGMTHDPVNEGHDA